MNQIKSNFFCLIIGLITITGGPLHGTENTCAYDASCCPSNSISCDTPCGTAFLRGDLLYFKPYESQLDQCGSFNTQEVVNTQSQTISTTTNSSKEPTFNWDLGFRAAAGIEFANCCWDLGVYWMHYQTKTHRGWESNCLNWTLNLDVLDVLIGRSYCCGEMSFRPFGGLRGIQIRQHVDVNFVDTLNSSGVLTTIFDSGCHHESLKAGGFLLGIESEYPLCYGFSLYASAAVSAVYGQFRLKEDTLATSSMGQSTTFNEKHFNSCTNIGDLVVGVRWSTRLTETLQLVQQVSWEHHCFFDYNQIGHNGDLSLDGVGYFASIEF